MNFKNFFKKKSKPKPKANVLPRVSVATMSGNYPSGSVSGDIVYNTDTNEMMCFNGTAWVNISGSNVDPNLDADGYYRVTDAYMTPVVIPLQ